MRNRTAVADDGSSTAPFGMQDVAEGATGDLTVRHNGTALTSATVEVMARDGDCAWKSAVGSPEFGLEEAVFMAERTRRRRNSRWTSRRQEQPVSFSDGSASVKVRLAPPPSVPGASTEERGGGGTMTDSQCR